MYCNVKHLYKESVNHNVTFILYKESVEHIGTLNVSMFHNMKRIIITSSKKQSNYVDAHSKEF